MNRKTLLALAGLGAFSHCWAVPIVSNVRMQQIEGTKDVRITYDLADNVNTQLWVSVSAKPMTSIADWGTEYFPMSSVEGDVRRWVMPGVGKEIIWHAGVDWNGRLTDSAKATVHAVAKTKSTLGSCAEQNLKFTGSSSWSYGRAYLGSDAGDVSLYTKVHGSGRLRFRWSIDNYSSSSYSYLYFYVDGVQIAVLNSATSAHSKLSEQIYDITSSGYHEIRWRFDKNVSYSGSTYSAYVYDVVWK